VRLSWDRRSDGVQNRAAESKKCLNYNIFCPCEHGAPDMGRILGPARLPFPSLSCRREKAHKIAKLQYD